MTPEEIRVRSVYLFLGCSQAVEQFTDQLSTVFPTPPISSKLVLERALRKELGILFRYWATRQIWARLESCEEDAKLLNLALLRLFTTTFQLPQDGTGLRYAELSTLTEEARELSHRVTHVLGMEHPPLLQRLHAGIGSWRDAVTRYTIEALQLPLEQLTSRVRQWSERQPGATDSPPVA